MRVAASSSPGTGTEVGKTVVAAAILRAARGRGRRVAVFKPAVSGLDDYPPAPRSGRAPRRCPITRCSAWRRDRARATTRSRPTATARRSRRTSPPSCRASGSTRSARGAALAATEGRGPARLRGVGGFLVPSLRRLPGARLRAGLGPAGRDRRLARASGRSTTRCSRSRRSGPPASESALVVLNPWPASPRRWRARTGRRSSELGAVAVETLPRLDLTSTRPPLDVSGPGGSERLAPPVARRPPRWAASSASAGRPPDQGHRRPRGPATPRSAASSIALLRASTKVGACAPGGRRAERDRSRCRAGPGRSRRSRRRRPCRRSSGTSAGRRRRRRPSAR